MRQQKQSLLSRQQRQKSLSSPSPSSYSMNDFFNFLAVAIGIAVFFLFFAWLAGFLPLKKSTSESTMPPSSKPLFQYFVSSTATPVV